MNAISNDFIKSNNFNPNKLSLEEIFPFPLDDFQLEAIDSLNRGNSVVVSAPTGSGKTLIGEYAIHRAILHKKKGLLHNTSQGTL